MLGKVTDIQSTRDIVSAAAFYLVTSIFMVGLFGVVVHLIDMLELGSFLGGLDAKVAVGTGWVLLLSSLILSKKNLTRDIFAVILAITGIYLSFTVTAFVGMIPVAILTMLKKG